MNILPKKRWHVRTKDNITRVRRDQEKAREDELKRKEKLDFAESEARINYLRKQSGLPDRQAESSSNAAVTCSTVQHVDLFADYKTHIKTTNKDLEKEKKEEQEKYEKQIGYLTYLGQNTNESLKLKSWYEVAPKRGQVGDCDAIGKDLKIKNAQDPLTLINVLMPSEKKVESYLQQSRKRKLSVETNRIASTEKDSKSDQIISQQMQQHKSKKHKKEKRHNHNKQRNSIETEKKKKKKRKDKRDSDALDQSYQQKRNMIEKLRIERLRREASERVRQDALLEPSKLDKNMLSKSQAQSLEATPRIVQKYNSQFNPELAKQNML